LIINRLDSCFHAAVLPFRKISKELGGIKCLALGPGGSLFAGYQKPILTKRPGGTMTTDYATSPFRGDVAEKQGLITAPGPGRKALCGKWWLIIF